MINELLQLVHSTSLVLPSRHSTGSCLESLRTCHQVHVAYQRCSLSSRRVNNSYLYCCRRIDAYTNIKLRCHQFIPAVHTRRRAIGFTQSDQLPHSTVHRRDMLPETECVLEWRRYHHVQYCCVISHYFTGREEAACSVSLSAWYQESCALIL